MNEVEAVARAIAPSRWEVMDHYLAQTKKKYAGENAAYDPDNFKDRESMATAQAAIAVIAADRAGLVAEIERLREAVGILEDGLQEVGDDYPGSSCQEWCQHQIKQARAALKDTRNDADA